ncbi:MAG TPA: HEAT repeat domain-containing protein [Solirubrobacteraceae bacterium]|nr:HEAT repeat domain-containing protein [Solirubrobacteraceae bacterium]
MWHRERGGISGAEPDRGTDASRRLLELRALPADQNALAQLLAATGDSSIEVTREALRWLARLGGLAEAQVLRGRLWRADPSLVADFAACIATLGDRGAIEEALAKLDQGGDESLTYGQRLAAVQILAAFGDPATVPALRGALLDPIAAVRRAALSALRAFPTDADSQQAAIGCLSDSDPQVRAAAVAAVAALCPDAPRRLAGLAADENSGVRLALARTASRLADTPVALLLADSEISVRVRAAEHAGSRAVVPLARAMRLDHSPVVRLAAANRLGELHAAGATVELIDALADRDSLVKVAALRSLEAVHGREPLAGLLLDTLCDRSRENRGALVYALGRLDAADQLGALARDRDPQVRTALAFVERESRRNTAVEIPGPHTIRRRRQAR